jgi:hypothetical protein
MTVKLEFLEEFKELGLDENIVRFLLSKNKIDEDALLHLCYNYFRRTPGERVKLGVWKGKKPKKHVSHSKKFGSSE